MQMKTIKELEKEIEEYKEMGDDAYKQNEIEAKARLQTLKDVLGLIDEELDFMDNYPIWTDLINKETKKKEEIPEWLYEILDRFWENMKKTIKRELKQEITGDVK